MNKMIQKLMFVAVLASVPTVATPAMSSGAAGAARGGCVIQ